MGDYCEAVTEILLSFINLDIENMGDYRETVTEIISIRTWLSQGRIEPKILDQICHEDIKCIFSQRLPHTDSFAHPIGDKSLLPLYAGIALVIPLQKSIRIKFLRVVPVCRISHKLHQVKCGLAVFRDCVAFHLNFFCHPVKTSHK